eukprot:scaffold251639_cov33-Tisochrysis_lutea.AAC.1
MPRREPANHGLVVARRLSLPSRCIRSVHGLPSEPLQAYIPSSNSLSGTRSSRKHNNNSQMRWHEAARACQQSSRR